MNQSVVQNSTTLMVRLQCKFCKKDFDIHPSLGGKRKTCSRSCAAKLRVGERNSFYGKKHSDETKLKMRNAKLGLRGKNTNRWLGIKAKYRAVHMWIGAILGKPTTCERCGCSELKGHNIHWANKSGQYKRDLSDWLRLCAACHKEYDNFYIERKEGNYCAI